MAIEAWYLKETGEDQRLPYKGNAPEYVSMDKLADLGVLIWKLNPTNYENENGEEFNKIRVSRGYNYMDILELSPEKIEDHETELKDFYTEHMHDEEEIRYCLEGSCYFDVRDKEDRWVRIWTKAGDLIVLPAEMYHRFTLDTSNRIKMVRLFIDQPFWSKKDRPQEEHPAREEYIKSLNGINERAVEAQ